LRVLIVSHYALPHLGGIEIATDGLARALQARGHSVAHVASDATRGEDPIASSPYAVHRVRAFNGLEDRLHIPYPMFSPRLAGVLRRRIARADIVHAHGLLYQGTLAALAVGRRRGVPVVVTEHVGHVPYDKVAIDRAEAAALASIGRIAARAASAVVALNEGVETLVSRLAPRTPVERIPNGVDTTAYRPPDPRERDELRARYGWDAIPRALFVGRLVGKKGLPLAFAAHEAAHDAWRLVVVGPGSPPAEVPHGVELLGPRPREEVARLYRAADAFLLPSRGEGFPVTVQEALASGLPAVLLQDRNYADYVDVAGRAIRMGPPDPEFLASVVAEAVADSSAREQAVAHARSRFSWEPSAAAHEALYRRLSLRSARPTGDLSV
jgi:D-inositol-3-phosphate glycosyltransferase